MSESENSATSEVYEVEWIERKRIDNNGVTSYFIKWKGFEGMFTLFCAPELTSSQPTNSNHLSPCLFTFFRKREHLGKHRASRPPWPTLELLELIELTNPILIHRS